MNELEKRLATLKHNFTNMKKTITISCLLLFGLQVHLFANDIKFTELPVIKSINTVAETADLEFSISWDNSWRSDMPGIGNAAPYNYDAAWVFVKYSGADGIWKHATLMTDGHSTPAEATFSIPSDKKGAFIYRAENGSGTNIWDNIVLRWDYGFDGVTDLLDIEIRVFAIEMVYVPSGVFYIGDGNTSAVLGVFHEIGTTDPYFVTEEGVITLGGIIAGNLGNSHTGDGQHSADLRDDYNNSVGAEQILPASYPKGYQAFYSMKYNITQKQYVDFLNTLTREQQNRRTFTNITSGLTSVTNRYVMTNTNAPSSRNGIRIDYSFPPNDPIVFYNDLNDGTPNQADDGQHLPMNFIAFADGTAYADWAGLRPMTELEYEKATRGSQAPVIDEMAWGETYSLGVTAIVISGLTNSGTNNELPLNETANCHINNNDVNVNGPVRAGVFSTSTSNRLKSGATYYGIMDMGGTLTEQVITTGNPEGRSFDGRHGDGELASTGVNNVLNWPGSGSTLLTDVIGGGIRSNSFASTGLGSRISVRRFANDVQKGRVRSMGFRLVRTAP